MLGDFQSAEKRVLEPARTTFGKRTGCGPCCVGSPFWLPASKQSKRCKQFFWFFVTCCALCLGIVFVCKLARKLLIQTCRVCFSLKVLVAHWTEFGRNYFTRYDYEQVSSEKGAAVIAKMSTYVDDPASIVGKSFGPYKVASVDNFRYVDPVDQSVTEKQGIRVVFEDGSRIIMRLSGTGSSGATIRMYVDSYVAGPDGLEKKVQDALEPLVAAALELSDLAQLTGRDAPTVIT
eukprot:m.21830 g.21830  ORF g.21830 m.21830 type:complete len:234 (-) comp6575_c0_seq2:125-826(-)